MTSIEAGSAPRATRTTLSRALATSPLPPTNGASVRTSACATAARAPGGYTGTVVVNHNCVADALHAIQFGPTSRALPGLRLLQIGDVVGLVVAHEIGHIAGLRHGDGVMHARLTPTDLVAFQAGSLRFARTEAATLRTALLVERPVVATARRATPED